MNTNYTSEQIMFADIWQRLKEGTATPEEIEWLLNTQTEYYDD